MDLDQIKLNRKLCTYLSRKLEKTKSALEEHKREYDKRASIRRGTNPQERAFREVELVVKRGEDLLLKCMCKQSSWLDAAMTLANIKEDVLDIVLDLSFWKHMLKIAIDHANRGESAVLSSAAKAVKKDEDLHKKLLEEDSSLQKAAADDMLDLLAKLLEVKEKHDGCGQGSTVSTHEREEYILSVYLLSCLKDDKISTEVESQLEKIKWGTPLGVGSYGQVSEVEWLNRRCVAKKSQDTDPKEANISRGCTHPNIVQFFWFWQEQESSYIIMERMQQDLYTHIKHRLVETKEEKNGGRPFQWHVAIDIMLQIAKAMRYLHNKKPQRIVHRDLKTKNILVRPLADNSQGYMQVKLADFGISKFYNLSETSAFTLKKGTTVYAAPEVFYQQAKHGSNMPKLPPKIDVWSFAMVCSEILTGIMPFEGQQKSNLHARIEEDEEFRPLLPSDCPEDLCLCITRCWECDPKKRPTFAEVCKMLKLAKARSLGIIQFNYFEVLFPAPTIRFVTSEHQATGSEGDSSGRYTPPCTSSFVSERGFFPPTLSAVASLTPSEGDINTEKTVGLQVEEISSLPARGLNPWPLSGPELVDLVEGKQVFHGNGANESSITSLEIEVPSDSIMAGPVVYEGIHSYHDGASHDQTLEGDIRNRLAPGAPNSLPTSEPQAQGVGPTTVATLATVLPQGTIDLRKPASPQPMMMMWNKEEERQPQDPSRVNRPPEPLLPQHCHLCGGEGHQFGGCHFSPSLLDERTLGQSYKSSIPPTAEPAPAVSSQDETRATANQSVILDLLFEIEVLRLLQSKMVTPTIQPTAPTKGTTQVIQERDWYPATEPAALPPHSTGTDIDQRTWPPYGGLRTSVRPNLPSEVQPPVATGFAIGSNVDREGGQQNGPQHCRLCGEEGHQLRGCHHLTSLIDERMLGQFHESSITPTGKPGPVVSSQIEARATGNQSVILDLLSEARGVGLSQSKMVTPTIQPTAPTKGITQVIQERDRYPATVPGALPPHNSMQHSTGTAISQMVWPPYGGLSTSVRPNLTSEVQPPVATGFASGSNVDKEGGQQNELQHCRLCGEEGHQLRGCHHLTALMDERMLGQFRESSIIPTGKPAPVVCSQIEARSTGNQSVILDLLSEGRVGLPQSKMVTPTIQSTDPMKGTTQVIQERDQHPATVPVALPHHGGMQHSTRTSMGQMTRPPYGELPSSFMTNLSSEMQPPVANFAGGSNVEKEGGLENGPQHGHLRGEEGHQFRACHHLTSPMDEQMLGRFHKSSIDAMTESELVVSSQNKANNQQVNLDLFETGVGLPQFGTVATTAQHTTTMKGTTQVTQERAWSPAAGPVELPPHSGRQHSIGTSMGQMTRPPYGGLLTSNGANLSSEVQAPAAGFASGSNKEKESGLENGPVDDGQQQQEDPGKSDPLFQNGLRGTDSNLVDRMGWNAAQKPTFKSLQVQIALEQDTLMAKDAELMAKEEERKKCRAYDKDMNMQLNHRQDSRGKEKRL